MELEHDSFGIEREKKIKKSGVREVFTPHQPIQEIDLLMGRKNEVKNLIEYLNTPGQHALLFGDRGVGKSSLAHITTVLLMKNLGVSKIITKRCDSSDTFRSIVAEILEEVGIDISITERNKSGSIGGNLGPFTGSGKKSTKARGYEEKADSPSWVAKKTAHIEGVFLIDELDSIKDTEDKKKLAELVKQLSDTGSSLKLLIVGIAETASDLTAGHPSVIRSLKETRLNRMTEDELQEIIETGQEKIGIKFTDEAIKRIVAVSSGYPHFTHLLALKAAEDVVVSEQTKVTVSDVEKATRRAVEDAEGTLKKSYDDAIRSAQSENYEKIILAAALSSAEEITAEQLRRKYSELFGEDISQQSLNNYFQKLVSTDGTKILRRLAKGVYRFSDPRMPSFVRITHSYIS